MDRATAERLISKLDALADPDQNIHEAERTLARDKATRLRRQFGIGCETPRSRPAPASPPPPKTSPAPGAWGFDIRTGAHTPNVKVGHYNSPRDWKIEVFF